MHFGEDEKESLEKLETFHRPVAFEYIAQSTRSATYTTRLAMLIIALESIAGEVSPGKTNMDFIKNDILKDEVLHDEIFKFGTGIRNDIFHGKAIVSGRDYAQIIYGKIVAYFNEKYDTKISTVVTQPQRTPFGNYMGYHCWFQPRSEFSDWNLREIVENHDNLNSQNSKKTKEIYFDMVASPEQY